MLDHADISDDPGLKCGFSHWAIGATVGSISTILYLCGGERAQQEDPIP